MSLPINVTKVTEVMIGGSWHLVAPVTAGEPTSSFRIGHYEYVDGPDLWNSGGEDDRDLSSPAFTFIEAAKRNTVSGPLSAIQAVRHWR